MGPICYPMYSKLGDSVKDKNSSPIITSVDVTNSGSIKTVELRFGMIHVKSVRS